MKWILVGGRYGGDGRESGYAKKLYDSIQAAMPFAGVFFNGGTFELLLSIFEDISIYDVIIWMPDVDNRRRKLVNRIKVKAPKAILVTSKNNREDKYTTQDLVGRALKAKSNLFIEFTGKNPVWAKVMDPLGNQFICSQKISSVGATIAARVFELSRITRAGSVKIDDSTKVLDSNKGDSEFLNM